MIIRLFFLLLLAFFGVSIVHAQSEVDSIKKLIHTSKNDSLKMEWYNVLRRITYYSNIDESFIYTKKYLELAQKKKYPKKIALGQYYLANAYVTKSDYEKALDYYLKSIVYFEKEGDSSSLASMYNGIGAAYENYGNDTLSLKYFTKSHKISESIGDMRRSALALNNIANIYTNRGDNERSIVYLRQAVQKLSESDKQYLHLIRVNLANALVGANKLHEASEIYTSVLSTIVKEEDMFTYLLAMKGKGTIHLNNGEYAQAVNYLEEAFQCATEGNFVEQRNEMMPDLVDAYKANGNYEEGMNLLFELMTFKDSTFNSEKDKNLSEAIQKYESEKKDKEIAEKNLRITQQGIEKNWLIGGTIGFIFIALGVFLFYRSRLKYQSTIAQQTKELQQQKITELEQNSKLLAMNSMIAGQEAERMRIAKDLHDGLGGLLSTVKAHFSMLKSEREENSEVYQKTNELIDEACVDVRRISHNMMPHALSISGLEAALTDLGESLRLDGISATIEINRIPKILDSTKSITIYRLVQQLVANIRKHAEAKNVLLQLLVYKDTITLTVEDDGKGFDINEAKKADGLGLKSIFTRVEFLNGKLDLDTAKNRGTTFTIEIPIV